MAELSFLRDQIPNLLIGLPAQRPGGLLLSLLLLAAAFPAGFLLALPAALIRSAAARPAGAGVRLLAGCAEVATTILRGVPLVLLLLLAHLLATQRVFGEGGRDWQPAWLALTLVTAAYQTEILVGGLRAVPPDVREAAAAGGLSRWDRAIAIDAPIATRAVLPALAGQAISIFKDTAVVFMLGLPELFTTANHLLNGGNERYFLALYLALGALYFLPAWAIGRWANRLERRPGTIAAPDWRLGWASPGQGPARSERVTARAHPGDRSFK